MFLQVLLGLPLVIAVFALSVSAALSSDQIQQKRFSARVCRLVLGYGVVAFALALLYWWTHRDWVHGLWTSTHPQIVLCITAGAFLIRDEWGRHTGTTRFGWGPWIVLALLLAFALLPAALIQWAPDPAAAPRNLGRPIAGTLEVARFGLGGPVPATLIPEILKSRDGSSLHGASTALVKDSSSSASRMASSAARASRPSWERRKLKVWKATCPDSVGVL